jgi:hypothetical protein
VPIPFAVIGAIFMSTLWNVTPKSVRVPTPDALTVADVEA